jgi:adenylate cyclase
MPGGVDQKVVILDIDEKSLKEREHGGEGRWPWPRDRLALILDKLFDKYQIEVLGFDVFFPERDETSGVRVLERLAGNDLRPKNAGAKDRARLFVSGRRSRPKRHAACAGFRIGSATRP